MIHIKRVLFLFAVFAASLRPERAHATLLHVNAHATVDESYFFTDDYVPIGTVLHASVDFDVSGTAGVDTFPIVGPASGLVTWNDGLAREFTVTGARPRFVTGTGLVAVAYTGTGPTINSIEPRGFSVTYDIGERADRATDPWDELLLHSTIASMGVWLERDPVSVMVQIAHEDPSGSVSAVPEPSTILLLTSGLVLGLSRRRRSHQPAPIARLTPSSHSPILIR